MPHKILVIDDEDLVLRSLSKLLKREGYEVQISLSPKKAVEMAAQEDFDLIVCDIRMPEMSGTDTIKKKFVKFQKRQFPRYLLQATPKIQ